MADQSPEEKPETRYSKRMLRAGALAFIALLVGVFAFYVNWDDFFGYAGEVQQADPEYVREHASESAPFDYAWDNSGRWLWRSYCSDCHQKFKSGNFLSEEEVREIAFKNYSDEEFAEYLLWQEESPDSSQKRHPMKFLTGDEAGALDAEEVAEIRGMLVNYYLFWDL